MFADYRTNSTRSQFKLEHDTVRAAVHSEHRVGRADELFGRGEQKMHSRVDQVIQGSSHAHARHSTVQSTGRSVSDRIRQSHVLA